MSQWQQQQQQQQINILSRKANDIDIFLHNIKATTQDSPSPQG